MKEQYTPPSDYKEVDDLYQGKNYYEILGVNNAVSPEELHQAFRQLSLQHHPDRGEI